MNSKHGMTGTPEYEAWQGMRLRCYSETNRSYPDYGGRGISVCERWRSSPAAFLADMGKRPSAHHSIDRINNDGNYEPGNCRWATASEQAANTRRTPRRLKRTAVIQTLRSWGMTFVDIAAIVGLSAGHTGNLSKQPPVEPEATK